MKAGDRSAEAPASAEPPKKRYSMTSVIAAADNTLTSEVEAIALSIAKEAIIFLMPAPPPRARFSARSESLVLPADDSGSEDTESSSSRRLSVQLSELFESASEPAAFPTGSHAAPSSRQSWALLKPPTANGSQRRMLERRIAYHSSPRRLTLQRHTLLLPQWPHGCSRRSPTSPASSDRRHPIGS